MAGSYITPLSGELTKRFGGKLFVQTVRKKRRHLLLHVCVCVCVCVCVRERECECVCVCSLRCG